MIYKEIYKIIININIYIYKKIYKEKKYIRKKYINILL